MPNFDWYAKVFRGGWRPALGWVTTLAFLMHFLAKLSGNEGLDLESLLALLGLMTVGVGARSYEKMTADKIANGYHDVVYDTGEFPDDGKIQSSR